MESLKLWWREHVPGTSHETDDRRSKLWGFVIPEISEMLLASVVSMDPFRGHTTTLGTAAGDL